MITNYTSVTYGCENQLGKLSFPYPSPDSGAVVMIAAKVCSVNCSESATPGFCFLTLLVSTFQWRRHEILIGGGDGFIGTQTNLPTPKT